MKAVTISNLKKELKLKNEAEKTELILRLARFKKENKELLTYLLFEQDYEEGYVESVKVEMDVLFDEINTTSMYFMKKSMRKILRNIKKYIRYSKKAETEVALLLYFCERAIHFQPSIMRNTAMVNLIQRQKSLVEKKLLTMHEDLQYDYRQELDVLF